MVDKRALKRSSDPQIAAFLAKAKALSPSAQQGRLIFALDATASRQPTWDRACQLQGDMFTQAAALGGIAVQLVWYRGYREFVAQPWCQNAHDLQRAMSGVSCAGGLTQIERVLRHAREQTKQFSVKALVFIGDCVEESPTPLYDLAGQFALLGIPIFLFHEGNDAEAASIFKRIAKLSRGAYCCFDASSAEQLRELLRAVSIFVAGGTQALLSSSKHGKVTKQLIQQLTRSR